VGAINYQVDVPMSQGRAETFIRVCWRKGLLTSQAVGMAYGSAMHLWMKFGHGCQLVDWAMLERISFEDALI
jgi:hypothetical protein